MVEEVRGRGRRTVTERLLGFVSCLAIAVFYRGPHSISSHTCLAYGLRVACPFSSKVLFCPKLDQLENLQGVSLKFKTLDTPKTQFPQNYSEK